MVDKKCRRNEMTEKDVLMPMTRLLQAILMLIIK